MNWYYTDGGRSYGPLSFDELRALYHAGALAPGSAVWHEGQPAHTTAAALFTVAPGSAATPSSSGRRLPQEDHTRPEPVGFGGWLSPYTVAHAVSVPFAALFLFAIVVTAARGELSSAGDLPPGVAAFGFACTLCLSALYFGRSPLWPPVSVVVNALGGVLIWLGTKDSFDEVPVWLLVAVVVGHTVYVQSSRRVRNTFTGQPTEAEAGRLPKTRLLVIPSGRIAVWAAVGVAGLAGLFTYPLETVVVACVGGLGYALYVSRKGGRGARW